MNRIIETITWIKARHIFGLIMLTMALAIVQRPFGTVTTISNQIGLTPLQYAIIIASCGTMMIITKLSLLWRSILMLPFLFYIIFSVRFAYLNPDVPYVPVIIYFGLYVLTLYFTTMEELKPDD